MHLVLQLAGLVLLAWHSSGYAINDADSSEYYDDYEHVDRHSTYYDEIEVYEDLIPLLKELHHLNADELDEIMKLIASLQDDQLYSDEEVIRPKRSKVHDSKDMAGDTVTTEHIVIPEHEKLIKEVGEVKNEDRHKTNEVSNAVDSKDRFYKEAGIEHEIKEMNSMEQEIEIIDEFLLKEEIINKEFEETESIEHVMENLKSLLMLEEEFLTEKERGSDEKIDRTARNSEWFGPIYRDYPWYPTWYPPYPWDFYQGYPPYFNPYPVAFPVNPDSGCNPALCDVVTKQYVPVKGKVTIATSFTDGVWSMPASFSMPRNSDPYFYPDYDCAIPHYGNFISNEPGATAANYDRSDRNCQIDNVINAPIDSQGKIPVSGKVTIAAHFPC